MARMEAGSIDACVCDPPYHLTSVTKRFGKPGSAPAKHGTDGLYARQSAGFMGKQWDGGDVAYRPETWAAVLRVLKPGGHLVAFGGTRVVRH
jgi:site-specific DNA-methyltransferase (adenine-specific)